MPGLSAPGHGAELVGQRPVVAVVCDVIYPYSRGGRELRNQELLPRLADHADVHVYTMQWWDGPPVRREGGVTYHAISRLHPLYRHGRRSVRQAAWFALASLRLLRCQFDVLDADQIPYVQLFVLRLVATVKRKPFTVTWHEVWSRSYWREYLGPAGWAAWAVERLAMRLPDGIIAASAQTEERLRRVLGSDTPITTVPNGIDLGAIRAAYPEADPTDLVVVGRLIEHKRVGMVLDVLARLHASGRHGHLPHHRRWTRAGRAGAAGASTGHRAVSRVPDRCRRAERAVRPAQVGPAVRIPVGPGGVRHGCAGSHRLWPAGADHIRAGQPCAAPGAGLLAGDRVRA